MGSEGVFVDVDEAAALLGVTPQMVNKYVENGVLTAHYPDMKSGSTRGKRRFRRDDVEALSELRDAGIGSDFASLRSHLLGMAVKVRRHERVLDELMNYLGMSDHRLPSDLEGVMSLHMEAQEMCEATLEANDQRDVIWARRLLPISEEYLDVVKHYTKEEKPWEVYMQSLKRLLEIHAHPGPVRTVLEHALLNLRNAAFLFVSQTQDVRAAKREFPHASYTGRVYNLLFPKN